MSRQKPVLRPTPAGALFPPEDTTSTEARARGGTAKASDELIPSGRDRSASEVRSAETGPHAPETGKDADGKRWRKRCVVRGRAVLPVDLRMKPAIAAIAGTLLAMLLSPAESTDVTIELMLANIAKAHIYEKPGRSYSRRKRNGRRKGKGKGNAKAQYRRRKQRRAQKRTKPG